MCDGFKLTIIKSKHYSRYRNIQVSWNVKHIIWISYVSEDRSAFIFRRKKNCDLPKRRKLSAHYDVPEELDLH